MPAGARKLGLSFWAGPLTLDPHEETRGSRSGDSGAAERGAPRAVAPRGASADGDGRRSHRRSQREPFLAAEPTTAAHVIEELDGRVDLILDAGPTDIGLESTIVDFTVDPPVLRRPGGITFEQVLLLVPEVVVDRAASGDSDDPRSLPDS